jgi:chorismate dehydratase
MNLPVPLYYGKKIVYTADGSITFYDLQYKEAYRAKSAGAYTESLHKFINPSGIKELVKKKAVTILDLCTGCGNNLAVLLDVLARIKNKYDVFIITVDKDENINNIIINSFFLWPQEGFRRLKLLLSGHSIDGITLCQYITDAKIFLEHCTFMFDVIFFDPFSKKSNDDLWNINIYKKLFCLLQKNGRVLTYASAKHIIKDFESIGFKYIKIPKLQDSFSNSSLFIKE